MAERQERHKALPKAAIADEIRTRIGSGRLALGARIYDKDLAAELAVSRTPVREALLLLQSEGLVVMKPQSGTFVFDPSAEDLRQICATRAIIEAGAVRLMLEAEAAAALAELGLLVGRAAVALEDGDLAKCDDLDCRFHEGLVAATGNKYLIRAYSGIAVQLRALRQRMPLQRERIAQAIAQHRRIIDLGAAGRSAQAAAEITAHVSNVARLLSAVRGAVRGEG